MPADIGSGKRENEPPAGTQQSAEQEGVHRGDADRIEGSPKAEGRVAAVEKGYVQQTRHRIADATSNGETSKGDLPLFEDLLPAQHEFARVE